MISSYISIAPFLQLCLLNQKHPFLGVPFILEIFNFPYKTKLFRKARNGTRTHDFLITSEVLYQLSYSSILLILYCPEYPQVILYILFRFMQLFFLFSYDKLYNFFILEVFMKPFLEFNSVNCSYNTNNSKSNALVNINFKIEKGEIVSIVTPFNSAKSAILSLISGNLTPDDGKIIINGDDKNNFLISIGYISHKKNILEWKTIYKDLSSPVNNADNGYLFDDNYYDKLAYNVNTQKRTTLIRTLISEPDLLLLDTVFSEFDCETKFKLIDDIYPTIKTDKQTVLITTNDLSEAITLSDKVIILSKNPSSVKKIIPIKFKDSSLLPSQKMNTKKFVFYFNEIWKQIN